MTKYNLGCGDDIQPGYVNVDFRRPHWIDDSFVECDLSEFPWPFPDGEAEEIMMLDFLEHFPYRQTERILLECRRMLREDGTVVIQVPDSLQLFNAISKDRRHFCNRCGNKMGISLGESRCPQCKQSLDDIEEAAVRRLFGGQDFPGNFHQNCFTQDSLIRKCEAVGLNLIGWEEEKHQALNWNFKGRFRKGDLW